MCVYIYIYVYLERLLRYSKARSTIQGGLTNISSVRAWLKMAAGLSAAGILTIETPRQPAANKKLPLPLSRSTACTAGPGPVSRRPSRSSLRASSPTRASKRPLPARRPPRRREPSGRRNRRETEPRSACRRVGTTEDREGRSSRSPGETQRVPHWLRDDRPPVFWSHRRHVLNLAA